MGHGWIARVVRSNRLPPAVLVGGVTLFFWHVLLRPTSAWVGDACEIDFQGTLQQLWLLRFHNYDIGEISRTIYMAYPTPVNLLSELGFLLDIGVLASMQALFGAILGYNIGALLLMVGLALAVYYCARRYGLPPWFAVVAGLLTVSAAPVAKELMAGRFYQILSLATATVCLAEWPRLTSGDRWAAIRTGIWLTVTVLAHAFTGQLIAVFLLVTAAATLLRTTKGQRKALLVQYLWAGGVLFVTAIGPVIIQLFYLPSGEESGGMFSGYEDYYLRVLNLQELVGLSPLHLVGLGHLRVAVLALATVALFLRRRQPGVPLFAGLFVSALFVVWGPYHHTVVTLGGSAPKA